MRFCLVVFVVVCFLAAPGQLDGAYTGPVPQQRITLRPCEGDGAGDKKEKALCGSFEVFEDRELRSGRKIALKIVVFPATGKDKAADPLFYIPGGPGSSATEDAPYVAQEYAKIREQRDLVFVDQRGTGGSNPLNCSYFDPSDAQSYLGHWNPPADVRKCRTQLEPNADLRLYTTSIAMDDLDDVRAALGYKQINIVGVSYGTRATQEYLRRHGKFVRSVILHGVSLTGQHMPGNFPLDTERALLGVLDECLANKACGKAFPKIKDDAMAVVERLRKGPVKVEATIDGKLTTLSLSRDLAGEAIRYMLYQSASASRVPMILNLAANGNFAPLAQAAYMYRRGIVSTGANGMYLSVTCAEDLPWVNNRESERKGENTFLGNYRLVQQREACELWPRGVISKDYASTVRTEVPALILSGQWDPVTPPAYGEIAAKNMPNSLHVIVPSGGHGFGGLEGLDCLSNLVVEFITRGRSKDLDISCVNKIHRPGFVITTPATKTQ